MSNSIKEKEKEIILKHNGYTIKLKIKRNYEEAKKVIKEALNFKDKDLEKYYLLYLDDDDDENNIDEDEFNDAFKSSNWVLRLKDDDTDDHKSK